MNLVVCPHCGNRRIVFSKVPKDVVVVLPCPSCHQLVVLFRGQVIAVNREIIEEGSFEDKKNHIAEIIAKFLEAGVFRNEISGMDADEGPVGFDAGRFAGRDQPEQGSEEDPITQEEFDRFSKIELKRIDEASYFRKHFGDS
jgi:ribosomal protein S27E